MTDDERGKRGGWQPPQWQQPPQPGQPVSTLPGQAPPGRAPAEGTPAQPWQPPPGQAPPQGTPAQPWQPAQPSGPPQGAPPQPWQQPPQGAPPQPWQQPPQAAPAQPWPSDPHGQPTWQPPAATGFFQAALARAFRLRIDPAEVLPSEREALSRATPPITEPDLQAFMAWRRSLLFVVAIALVPILVLRAIETFNVDEGHDETLLALGTIQFLVELGFTVLVWTLLSKWTAWRLQRRRLVIGWLVYFLTPFVLYLYPFRSLYQGNDPGEKLLVGMVFSVGAIMILAPKAISLMPALLRASIATKLLFPGAAAPGWVIVLAAPFYGLLAYVLLLMPYQITGSGWFVLGIAGLLGAQLFLGRVGFILAKPLPAQHALEAVRKARAGYLLFTTGGLVFIAVAMAELLDQLQIPVVSAINMLLVLFANVLLLTLIATDLLIVSLDRARGLSADERAQALSGANLDRLSAFVRGDTPDR